jgi:hypothetical protein
VNEHSIVTAEQWFLNSIVSTPDAVVIRLESSQNQVAECTIG